VTSSFPRIPLGRGREFDLIRRFLGPMEGPTPGVIVGPGDDCAVLEGGLVVSADLTVEGVHFRPEWITPKEAGYRATAAALSDLAAMAADPLGILLTLALDPSRVPDQGEEAVEGAREACRREGIALLGGDLTTTAGPMVMDVVVLGRTDCPVLRRGSLPGDEIWVTGWLGGSAAAVRLWNRGLEPPAGLREAFTHPAPRIREARWLARAGALHALIDLSDGLAGDAEHLAAASAVAVVLEEEALPLHPELEAGAGDRETALHLALSGGEDYELCFAVAPGAMEGGRAEEFRGSFQLPLTRVGRVAEGEGVSLISTDGSVRPLHRGGFRHFQEREEG